MLNILKSLLLWVLWGSSVCLAGMLSDQQSDTSLDQLEEKIRLLDESFATNKKDCYQKFFSNHCVDQLREQYVIERVRLLNEKSQLALTQRLNAYQHLSDRLASKQSELSQEELNAQQKIQVLLSTPPDTGAPILPNSSNSVRVTDKLCVPSVADSAPSK